MNSLTETNVATDDVRCPPIYRVVGSRNIRRYSRCEINGVAVNANALPGRGLAGDGQVVRRITTRLQNDGATDIEDDGAIRLAHRVAERTWTGIRQRRDVIDRPATRATG